MHGPVVSDPLHLIPLPVKVKQLDRVPIYVAHATVESIQPLPVVLHPVKNISHSVSVVATVLCVHNLAKHAPLPNDNQHLPSVVVRTF